MTECRTSVMTTCRETKRCKLGEDLVTRMSEETMPKCRPIGGNQGLCSQETKRVQRTGAIAPNDQPPGQKVLHRTTSGVKFKRAIVVRSKLADRNKIFNKSWRNKNIIKINAQEGMQR